MRKLSKKHPGISIKHYDLPDFVAKFPGHSFLTRIAGEETTEIMKNIGLKKRFNNNKIDPLQVEINYGQNILNELEGLDSNNSKYRKMLILLAQKRLAMTEAAKEKVAVQMKSLA